MLMIQLDPAIPVEVPQGKGLAIILRDYGAEHHDAGTPHRTGRKSLAAARSTE